MDVLSQATHDGTPEKHLSGLSGGRAAWTVILTDEGKSSCIAKGGHAPSRLSKSLEEVLGRARVTHFKLDFFVVVASETRTTAQTKKQNNNSTAPKSLKMWMLKEKDFAFVTRETQTAAKQRMLQIYNMLHHGVKMWMFKDKNRISLQNCQCYKIFFPFLS